MAEAERVRELFDAAVSLSAHDREELFRRNGYSGATVAEVRALLRSHDDTTNLLARAPGANHKLPAIQPGERIGVYRIEAEIGRGGMGVVYRATRADDAYRKTVAIKVVTTGAPIEIFRRERQILASLEHPNIARMVDGGETESGAVYLVMEFVDGVQMLDYAREREFDVTAKIALFEQVCGAVEYAHRSLVIHRDLKPGNILVTREGVPKLLDFGLSKVLDAAAGSPEATISGGMTPKYASPEQILQRPVNTASDVYSLGLILFDLLTGGAYPFKAGQGESMSYVEAALRGEPKRPSSVCRDVDADLDAICLKAIAREPEARYGTVAQFREDLERYRAGRPVRARDAGLLYRMVKFAARNKVATAALCAAAVAICGSVLGIVREARIANEQRQVALVASAAAQKSADEALRAAVTNQRLADEQTRLRQQAEGSAADAVRERNRAQDRMNRAQALASTLLFEVHDSVKNLQGSGETKQRILKTSLEQLEGLAREGGASDPKLWPMLAAAHERAGDILSGIAGEGTGTVKDAQRYYERAYEIRSRPSQVSGENSALPRSVLEAKIAITLGHAGRVDQGLEKAREARSRFDGLPAGVRASIAGLHTDYFLDAAMCELLNSMAGKPAEALVPCTSAARKVVVSGAGEGADFIALEQRGYALVQLALRAANQDDFGTAMTLLNGGTTMLKDCLMQAPKSAGCQRGLAAALTYMGTWRDRIGEDGSEDAYRQALAVFGSIEAHSSQTNLLEKYRAYVEARYAQALWQKSRQAEAGQLMRAALGRYERLVQKEGSDFAALNDYADRLLKCPIPAMRDDVKALLLAERANAVVKGRNAVVLDTLANAYFVNGRRDDAIRVGNQALAMAQQSRMTRLAGEIQASLRRFEAGAAAPQ